MTTAGIVQTDVVINKRQCLTRVVQIYLTKDVGRVAAVKSCVRSLTVCMY